MHLTSTVESKTLYTVSSHFLISSVFRVCILKPLLSHFFQGKEEFEQHQRQLLDKENITKQKVQLEQEQVRQQHPVAT